MQKLTTCLWFDAEGEEAARFYTSLFPNSKLGTVTRQTVSFELNGQDFVALNGGPRYTFTEAISFQVFCKTQDEVDTYWSKLSEGGEEGPCGWLKDRFGLSWQIVPTRLVELLSDPDPERSQRVTAAMHEMKKIQVDELARDAASGARPRPVQPVLPPAGAGRPRQGDHVQGHGDPGDVHAEGALRRLEADDALPDRDPDVRRQQPPVAAAPAEGRDRERA